MSKRPGVTARKRRAYANAFVADGATGPTGAMAATARDPGRGP